MAILFTVIAKNTTILAKYASRVGNFTQITDLMLNKVDTTQDTKMTYNSHPHFFHYLVHSGFVFLCITDEDFDRSLAFDCLTRICNQFMDKLKTQDGGSTLLPYSKNTEFSPIIQEEMRRAEMASKNLITFSAENEEDYKVKKLKSEVDQVKDIMVANIDSIVSRGERLELIVDKTESLSNESVSFRQATRRIERKMWWQNTKMKILCAIVVILVIYGIISASCGGPLWPKCVGHGYK